MFLNSLNDSQKDLFLDLAIKAADASRGISVQEKNMLKAFALEMRIPPKYECAESELGILDEMKKRSTKKELKIITFEILGIIYSDSEYDDVEKAFVDTLAKTFDIASECVDEMESIIKKYSSLYSEICDIVLSDE